MNTLYIIVIYIAIVMEGFFSGTEIAIISLNRIRLRILAEAKQRQAVRIYKMLNNPNRLLGTTLVGTNLSVVIASSLFTKLIYDTYGMSSEWVTTLILSPFILIFGEFIPKAIFSQSADSVTFYLGYLLKVFWKPFYPIVTLVNRFVNFILGAFIGDDLTKAKSLFVTREEIRYLIKESEAEGEIDPYERSIIYKILDFRKKKTKDIMRGLDKLVYLGDSNCIEDLLNKAKEFNYSRFPVLSESGEFNGLVNILDVIYEEDKKKPLKQFIRSLEYISADMDIDKALLFLQSKKQSLVLVKDPQANNIGFFTIRDLLEELVGEI